MPKSSVLSVTDLWVGISHAPRPPFLWKNTTFTAGWLWWGGLQGTWALAAAAKIFLAGHEPSQRPHLGPTVSGAAQVAASREQATEETVLCSLSYHTARACQKCAGSASGRC